MLAKLAPSADAEALHVAATAYVRDQVCPSEASRASWEEAAREINVVPRSVYERRAPRPDRAARVQTHVHCRLWHDSGLTLERIGDYVGHSDKRMDDRQVPPPNSGAHGRGPGSS